MLLVYYTVCSLAQKCVSIEIVWVKLCMKTRVVIFMWLLCKLEFYDMVPYLYLWICNAQKEYFNFIWLIFVWNLFISFSLAVILIFQFLIRSMKFIEKWNVYWGFNTECVQVPDIAENMIMMITYLKFTSQDWY